MITKTEKDLYTPAYTPITSLSISKKNKKTWLKVLTHKEESGQSLCDLFCECYTSCYSPAWDTNS